MPDLPPGPISYLSHWLINQVFWHLGNMGYYRLRKSYPDISGLALSWPFDARYAHPSPLLFAYSPSVLPRPRDWAASYIHVTGYLFLDTPATVQPPGRLVDFLDAGDPPVCVTFGSMVTADERRINDVVRLSLQQAHRRGIILRGWGGLEPDRPDIDLLYLDAAPHDWLFPRCRAIVHHGGAGTTAAALRSGVPNVVVSHAGDQFFWGKRVAALGAGPVPIPVKSLTVSALTGALAQADTPHMRASAQEIGRRIRAEDGLGECIRLIEQHAQAFPPRAA
jgi:sterol 3beta-glucosyltransferase